MNNQPEDYASKVRSEVAAKTQYSAASIISELKSLAILNQENLQSFRGINRELSESIEMSIDDVDSLNRLLSFSKEQLSKLESLKSKMGELDSYQISGFYDFHSRINSLINRICNNMKLAEIDEMQKEIRNLITEMEQFRIKKNDEYYEGIKNSAIKIVQLVIGVIITFGLLMLIFSS